MYIGTSLECPMNSTTKRALYSPSVAHPVFGFYFAIFLVILLIIIVRLAVILVVRTYVRNIGRDDGAKPFDALGVVVR